MHTSITSPLILLLIIQCTSNPAPERAEHFFVLDAIPKHIMDLENLAILPGDSEPRYSVEIILKQTYGKTGEPYLKNINDIIVDDQGRVIVLDTRSDYSHIIHVFNDDGTYHTELGGSGKGPGEYGYVLNVQAKDSSVYVRDFTGLRLNMYSTLDYSLRHTTLFETWKSSGDLLYIETRNDGKYLVAFSDTRSRVGRHEIKFLVMDGKGNSVDFEPLAFPAGFSIGVGEVMRPTMPLKFMGTTVNALSNEDVLHAVFTGEFLIKKYDSKGRYLSAIYYPIQGIPFDLDVHKPFGMFEPTLQDIRKAFASVSEVLPNSYPIVESLMVDDENRIWVAVPMDKSYEMLEWFLDHMNYLGTTHKVWTV